MPISQLNRRRVLAAVWMFAVVDIAVLLADPVSTTMRRALVLAAYGLLWGASLALVWRRKGVRWAFLIGTLGPTLLLVAPGRTCDPEVLRRAYVRSLRAYEGTSYWWGGENSIGIDCSGLVRKALIWAHVKCGVRVRNPALLRSAISLWWHDRSARALRDGYRQETRLLFRATSINQLNHDTLLPGDLAVTSTGVHVLAYLGSNTWCQADPGLGEVVSMEAPNDNTSWYAQPVHLMRWAQLGGAP